MNTYTADKHKTILSYLKAGKPFIVLEALWRLAAMAVAVIGSRLTFSIGGKP